MGIEKLFEPNLDWIWEEKAEREEAWKKAKYKRINQILGQIKAKYSGNHDFYTERKTDKQKVKWDTNPKFRNLERALRQFWPSVYLQDVLNKFGHNPICFLTGLPIDYAKRDTYHLDHLIPKSKGGPSTIENMQLVHPMTNLMKSDYSLEEFLRLCRLIAARHPG